MSLTKRVKQGFLRLPTMKKVILISSGLLMISPVMPWYDNRNTFGIGEAYLGVQGPLFLVGVLVLAFGAVSFFNIFLPLMGRNFFKLRRKSGLVSGLLGLQSMLLMAVANSIFFHPSFGGNVSHKGTRFGMLLAFIAIGGMIVAGWATWRREKSGDTDDIEDIMTNAVMEPEVAPEPVQAYTPPTPAPTPAPAYSRPAYSAAPVRTQTSFTEPEVASTPSPAPAPAPSGDPLEMDARARYKLMKQRERMSRAGQSNLWGNNSQSRLP